MDNDKDMNSILSEEIEVPQKPVILIRVSGDIQEAELELTRTGMETLNPVFEDVMQAAADAGVVYGIDENVIKAICQTPRYSFPMTIARGKKAKAGVDGSVKYLVDTSKNLRPKLRADGTVDYRDLGFSRNVVKGQALCEITLAQKGEDGMDVYGNVLTGSYGREASNVAGKNTEYSEDKTKLVALVSGNADVTRGIVNVNELLKIKGNIDNSTGDIHFVGDIIIGGDVISGFTVTSKGNITVNGTVEGASIRADGDVIVNEGINGMNRGSIEAGGNIKCRYIQSSYIKVKGNIYADSIMYCTTECGGDVELKGKRGVLIGGRAAITGVLRVNTVGTDSHIATHVLMCNTDSLQKELVELQKQVSQFDAELLRLEQVVNRYNDLKSKGIVKPELEASMAMVGTSVQQLLQSRAAAVANVKKVMQQQIDMSKSNSSYIECKGRIHSGVQISFGPLTMHVNQSFVYSRVYVADDEIRVSPLAGG